MNTDELVERLRAKVDSGRRTLGGGSISADGKATTWGNQLIMVYRNPDGPAAADEIERLTAELAEARQAERAAMSELNAHKDALAQVGGTFERDQHDRHD